MIPNSYRTGPKLENTNLLHSSPPVEFFKLFITDAFVTKMAEQTNSSTFMLFKEAHQYHSSQYLMGSLIYTFTSTSTQTVGEGQRQFLDVPDVNLTLFCPLSLKKSKQEMVHYELNTLCLFNKSLTLQILGVSIINVHVIIYQWKGQPCIDLKIIFSYVFQLGEEVVFFY